MMKTAVAKAVDARISTKHSMAICDEIRGKRMDFAKRFLENLLDRKIRIDGKYHPNAAKKILEILNSAEANAKIKGLSEEKLFLRKVSVDWGAGFVKPKSRWKLRGRRAKATNISVVVEER
jgi:ribosomal protein L22